VGIVAVLTISQLQFVLSAIYSHTLTPSSTIIPQTNFWQTAFFNEHHFFIRRSGIIYKKKKKKQKADYNDKMTECIHVPKLPKVPMGQASSCAVLTTSAFST
jgi:hypothetical protein